MAHYAYILTGVIIFPLIFSLLVSSYIYDFSNLYAFDWLHIFPTKEKLKIVNIHAGFDETSSILQQKFNASCLQVFDFYNPILHTEVSIKRARKAYAPYPDTISISTSKIPLDDQSIDFAFVIFSAHEIRNDEERIIFFKELNRIIKPDGRIIVTEHLRDFYNMLVYNIGGFHFHTKRTWRHTFSNAELHIEKAIKTTLFITHFILEKNGNTH